MEKVNFGDLLEDYYQKDNIHIVKVKGVEVYWLRRFSGRSEDYIYGLDKEQVDGLMNGTLPVENIMEDDYGWGSITEYGNMFSQERLMRWKRTGEEEQRRRDAENR